MANGPAHMARDTQLVDQVLATDEAQLRFYRWDPLTVSLGKHQTLSEETRKHWAQLGLDVVRRPSGGGAVLHEGDLTYAVAVPHLCHLSVPEAYQRLTEGLRLGLSRLGIQTDMPVWAPHEIHAHCFAVATQADLTWRGQKLVGSAQWRRKGVVLQHGSLLVDPDWALRKKLFGPAQMVSVKDILGTLPSWEAIAMALQQGLREILETRMQAC